MNTDNNDNSIQKKLIVKWMYITNTEIAPKYLTFSGLKVSRTKVLLTTTVNYPTFHNLHKYFYH